MIWVVQSWRCWGTYAAGFGGLERGRPPRGCWADWGPANPQTRRAASGEEQPEGKDARRPFGLGTLLQEASLRGLHSPLGATWGVAPAAEEARQGEPHSEKLRRTWPLGRTGCAASCPELRAPSPRSVGSRPSALCCRDGPSAGRG